MRIYWHSTAPWGPSSYSVLTKRAIPHIARDGHRVYVGSWFGLQGEPQQWDVGADYKVQILPQIPGDDYGVKGFLPMYRALQSDVAISVMDVWVLNAFHTEQTNFAPWFPVDHDPAPQAVIDVLQTAMHPMVYSKYGKRVLNDAGVEAAYVPCSASPDVYHPMDKAECRKKIGFPEDKFIITIIAANKDHQDRKSFAEMLQAFAKLWNKYGDKVVLYIHTRWGGAVKIAAILDSLNIPSEAVMKPDDIALLTGMFSDSHMAKVYNSSDVLLATSKSEGFGLPMLEAQMCGVPVIATDYSTSRELVSYGHFVKGQPSWTVGADTWRVTPEIDGIYQALEDKYLTAPSKAGQEQAVKHATQYAPETVYEKYWKPNLAEIERKIETARTLHKAAK